MGNVCCLLDACTVINLIHIDEDDFLLKKIKSLELKKSKPIEILIDELVFKEIQVNVNDRLKSGLSKYSDSNRIRGIRKEIDQKLSFYRGKKNRSEEMISELGNEYYEQIKKQVGYSKKINGELCSTAYALYLSRLDEKKVFFYTDDYPAKDFFSGYFEFQQIGQIKDTVDFLILIYWLDDDFNKSQLNRVLSELYSQYAIEVTLLRERLVKFHNEKVNGAFIKSKKEIAFKLKDLINKLQKLELQNIQSYFEYFEFNKTKCKELFEIIKQYYSVFQIESNNQSETLLEKIKRTNSLIEAQRIYKWNDLIAS